MVIINSNTSKTLYRSDVIGDFTGTVCPMCREEVCEDMAECEAEYNDIGEDVEEAYVRQDQHEALAYHKGW